MTELHHVKITEDCVELDGKKVKWVRAVQYTHVAGEIPVLNLQVAAIDPLLEEDAVVRTTIVGIQEELNEAEVIERFLGNLNPRELEQAVLAKMDWSTAGNGELTIEVLKEWAHGIRTA